ncbi:hypothetical protein ACIBI8_37575 [Streptomyces sp. NPDC050529]|uniref:hypothetical protein n=1 Tax=Streptomyces sp. NPDC050529 TaxID=3365624 RepID=UPI0037910B1B
MTNLATEVAQLKRRIAQIEKGQRISHGASIENAAVEVRDEDGSLRAIVGQQGDGTTGAIIVNGPPPPQPSDPIVASVLGGVTASWDGLFAAGALMPLDWARIEVHASTAPVFTPDSVTLQSTIETAQGATVVIACETAVYVRLVARTTSGTASAPSSTVGPYGPTPVVATDVLDGIVTTLKLADDAVTAAKVATGAIGTTEISDSAITTPKIVAGAVQTAQLDAEAVNASKIAAGAVTTAKLAALAVTANELAANAVTAGKILAGSVSAQALTIGVAQSIVTKLTDTMADSSTWARVGETGTYTTVTGVTDAVAGSTVLQVAGAASMERTENIPYDAAALYRVTVRLRTTTAPTAGSATVYLGVSGIAADGTTRVNVTGANAITSQHYIALSNTVITVGTAWTTVTGYIQGTAATGTAVTAADPRTPGKAHTNVRYIRPLLRLLNGATGGVMQVDQVTVETVPTGVVNSVNIVDGAITANAIAANTITATKLAAGSVDATALKADAITGKTITGGTITGATVQTATSGARLVMTSSGLAVLDSAGDLVAEIDPSDSTGRSAFATYDTRFGKEYYAVFTGGDLRFGITGATDVATEAFASYSSLGGGLYELLLSSGYEGSAVPGQVNIYSATSSTNDSHIDLNAATTITPGIFSAGNIAYGTVTVTTTAANSPGSAAVTGLNVKGSTFRAYVTASSGVPGTQLLGVSANNVTSAGMTVFATRTNTTSTSTNVYWLLIGT